MAKEFLLKNFKALPQEEQDQLNEQFKAQNTTLENYIDQILTYAPSLDYFAINAYLQSKNIAVLPKDITDEEAEKFYRENQEDFKTPANITVSHILILAPTEQMNSQNLSEAELKEKDAEAQKKLAEVKDKLAKGQKFEDLAAQYSDCPSGKNSKGQLPAFTEDGISIDNNMFDPDFTKAAYSIQNVGETTEVKTPFGYHIIRLDKKTPAEYIPFENISQEIKSYIANQKNTENILKHLEELRKSMNVVVNIPETSSDDAAPQDAE